MRMNVDLSELPHRPVLSDGTDLSQLPATTVLSWAANGCVNWGWRNSIVEDIHAGQVQHRITESRRAELGHNWLTLDSDLERVNFLKSHVQGGFGVPDSYIFRINAALADKLGQVLFDTYSAAPASRQSWVGAIARLLDPEASDRIAIMLASGPLNLCDLFGTEWPSARQVFESFGKSLAVLRRRLGDEGSLACMALLGYMKVPSWWRGPVWPAVVDGYLAIAHLPASVDPAVLRHTPWLLTDSAADWCVRSRDELEIPSTTVEANNEEALAFAAWALPAVPLSM